MDSLTLAREVLRLHALIGRRVDTFTAEELDAENPA